MERVLLFGIASVPLVCWPGLERPFSVPKLWAIGAIAALIGIDRLRRKPRELPGWPWLAWLAAIGISALTAPYVSLEALLLLVLPAAICAVEVASLAPILIVAGIESAIALLQFFRLDPFRWIGWQPEPFGSARMQVYGTLGNPDFIAAFLSATLPLCLLARPRIRIPLAVLQSAAILATGSRTPVIALAAAGLAFAFTGRRVANWWLAALVPAAGAIIWLSPARSLGTTVEGRLHLARMAAAHALEVPPAGFGPGSFRLQFADWQIARLREHGDEAVFAGPVDHAHDDYLEFWIEYGPLGLISALLLLFHARSFAPRKNSPATAALAALLAIACVDFPLHRPAEWFLFWVLISFTGQSWRATSCPSQSSGGCAQV